MNTFGGHQAFYSRVCKRAQAKRLALGAACLLLWGCAIPEMLAPKTTGEKYRQVLASIDAQCKKRGIGPYLDRSDPRFRSKAAVTDCEVLKVKPFDLNAVLATEEGKFAYSIKLPAPLDKPRVKRADYANTKEYFDALCRREVGDYVFASVRGVDGVAVLRTPPTPGIDTLGSYSQETMGAVAGNSPEYLLVFPPPRYSYVERRARADELRKGHASAIRRYIRHESRPATFPDYGLKYDIRNGMSARYGVTWRGTEELNDRENGIAGGDLIVLDRSNGNVIGVRREFRMDQVDASKKDRVELLSYPCPGVIPTDGHEFIRKVVMPVEPSEAPK
jgi:hypothetical protein